MESNDFLCMGGRKVALALDPSDNVGVVPADVPQGEICLVRGQGGEYDLQALEDIAFGHKMALRVLKKGDPILQNAHRHRKKSQFRRSGRSRAWVRAILLP
ncbi:MAG: hypothetical protein LBR31_08515 [Desulfovibrio sp.]|jgi:hypothetical protein|nr:hypothetical protein [Desulfovibrio sp.]